MALMGKHVDLVTGSASEIRAQHGNKIRTLAIFSEERLGAIWPPSPPRASRATKFSGR
ncbi:hypothetical protein OMD46_06925 [Pseudomonas sp. MDMC_285]|nr:hypothetical protein [Pseudomonas sp. MDMC_285]